MFQMDIYPNTISYNATISSCEKGAQWQLALHLLQSMPDKNTLPDVITYNATISCLEKGEQWQLALELLDTMPKSEIQPDIFTYNATMGACAKVSRLAKDMCFPHILGQVLCKGRMFSKLFLYIH